MRRKVDSRVAQWQGRLFLAPTVVILLLLTIFPFLFTLAMAFGKVSFEGGALKISLVGIRNWVRLIHDSRFWNALVVTLKIVGLSVFCEYVLGLLLAVLLNRRIRGRTFFRVTFLLPMMLAPIAVGYMWRMMLNDTRGPFNHILGHLGLTPVGWLSDPNVAMYSIILTDIWQWTPFMILILLAGLQGIPKDYIEAAKVDGASGWKIFLYVVFPLLTPASIAAIFLRSVEAFKIIDIIYIMTGGGPGLVTESLTLYGYSVGLRAFDLAYGATISFSLFFVVLASATLFFLLTRKARQISLE